MNNKTEIFQTFTLLGNIYKDAKRYEQNALTLFENAISCKSNIDAKRKFIEYLNDPVGDIDIWAMSTKCVTYPKPLDLYMIGNGNGNVDEIISNIMEANIHTKYDSYHMQLMYSSVKQNLKAIKALFKYGAIDVNYQDNNGFTALHWVLANGSGNYINILKYLLDKGALINIPEKSLSRTAVHLAVQTTNYGIIDTILTNATESDVNMLDINGVSPLAILLRLTLDNTEIINLLVEKGAKLYLVYPFIDELENIHGEKFKLFKTKIYDSIMLELNNTKKENAILNQNNKVLANQIHNNDQLLEDNQNLLEIIKNKDLIINNLKRNDLNIETQTKIIGHLTRYISGHKQMIFN